LLPGTEVFVNSTYNNLCVDCTTEAIILKYGETLIASWMQSSLLHWEVSQLYLTSVLAHRLEKFQS